ncbi:redoxin domain-containing protein [Candidatus Nitrospira bockiana]
MIQIGRHVSGGKYQAYHRDQIREIDLTGYRGTWVVLIFYPGDFTFICPTELAEAGRLYPEFQKLGAEVFGVSTDSVYVHKAWHDASPAVKTVDFPLIADPTGRLSREFGTYLEEEGVSLRGSFIIDPDGVLKAGEVHDNSIGRSAQELLRKLQAAVQVRDGGGEVCPASWRPGAKTLKPGLDLVGKI